MKVAIVGCGAMGSVYAGLLAGAGNEVIVVDRWQAHVDAIRTQGLRVEGASGDRVVQLQAYTQAPVQAMDLVIIAAKAVQVGDAANETKKLLGPQTVVLTIQNGLGSADTVAEIVGKERLVVGIAAAFGASLRGPGHAHHNSMNAVKMGAYADLAPARVEEVAALWRGAGFTADAVDNVAAMQWEKLICNVAFSAPCALTGLTVGQAMDDPDMGPTGLAAAVEAWKIALARKVSISVTDPEAHVRAFGERVRNARPSVLLDHDVRRPSEIDVINGAVPREAAKCGQFAPVNATLTALVRQRERNF
ncbi:ketopantoate reductase family protein [Polaromonas sp.]|uniref:ketopantoate reductase family protein n=1 Tax=Polaromonas sp. TaxID=1869339 RepID=UPI003BA9793E